MMKKVPPALSRKGRRLACQLLTLSTALSALKIPAQTDVEEVGINYIASRGALKFAVGICLIAQTELCADAIGDPAAAKVFADVLTQRPLAGRSVCVTHEVVRIRKHGIDRSGLFRKVKAGAQSDARNEVLVVVLINLDTV